MVLMLMLVVLIAPALALATAAAAVPLDFGRNASGRRFDGIGGLSGGGATSSAQPASSQLILTLFSHPLI
jgi:hypothetical protein